jgi:hypothetical protein
LDVKDEIMRKSEKNGENIILLREGHRILRSGGIALGLYHCRSDGHFRSLFPGLYQPLPDNHMDEIRARYEQQLAESGLEKLE